MDDYGVFDFWYKYVERAKRILIVIEIVKKKKRKVAGAKKQTLKN